MPSIGYSLTGEAFNLEYEDVACSVAEAVMADKLILYTGQSILKNDEGDAIRELSLRQAEELVETLRRSPEQQGEMAEMIALAVRAGRKGVKRCHVIDYREDGALINEMFTQDGSGTMVHDDEYEQIRAATIEDIAGIQALLQPLEQAGILVRRSGNCFENEIAHFVVDERDGSILGCAALYPYSTEKTGSWFALSFPRIIEKQGGDVLLNLIEKQAKSRGLKRIFVLTTQTEHWFREGVYFG